MPQGRVTGRLGRRGLSLVLLGMMAAVFAADAWFLAPHTAERAALAALAPLSVWGAAWVIVAAVCWVQAFSRSDRAAFAAAAAMWWLYGIVHVTGGGGVHDPAAGWIWIAFGVWVNVVATWPEPAPLVGPRPKGGAEAVITADEQGVIRSWSPGAERLLGWAAWEVIGHSIDVVIPRDLRDRHRAALGSVQYREDVAATWTRVVDTYALHRNGRAIPVQVIIGVAVASKGAAFSAMLRPRADRVVVPHTIPEGGG